MDMGLRPVNGGPSVAIRTWQGVMESYGAAGHQGQVAAYFTIDHPGRYVLASRNVTPRSITDLAVGRGVGHGLLYAGLLIPVGLFLLAMGVLACVVTAVRRRRARSRLSSPQTGPPAPGTWPPVPVHGAWPAGGPPGQALSSEPAGPNPILVEFAGPARQRRVTVLLRLILAFPNFFCLYFARMAALCVLVVAWFGALFTGRAPDFAAQFLAGFQQWEVRLASYLLLLSDQYPPIGWERADYPVNVVTRPGRLNRLSVLFRIILVVPAWLLWTVIAYGLAMIVMFISWLIVLIIGRMPQPLYEAIAAMLRYWARVKGYFYLLTSVYPLGLFGDEVLPSTSPGIGGYPVAEPGATLTSQSVVAGLAEEPATAPPTPAPELPADYVIGQQATAASSAAERPSWLLVLSGPAKWLVSMTMAVGAMIFVAPFLLFVLAGVAPPAGNGVNASAPVAGLSTSVPASPAGAASPTASAAATATHGPRGGVHRWLKGLDSLQSRLTYVLGSGSSVVTRASLRSDSRRLRSCASGLSSLGPPSARVRRVYQVASQACTDFTRAAACFDAAARAYTVSGPGLGKFGRLVDCGDHNTNHGSRLLVNAVADGYGLG
jgi:hypothetical protein